MELDDPGSFGLLTAGSRQAFEKVFTDWYGNLYAYAFSILQNEDMAAEVVQSVFGRIWEKRAQLQIRTSLKAYLYGSVYHECIDWLRQEKNKKAHRFHILRSADRTSADKATDKVELSELETKLRQALDELPDQCRAIFHLSRFGGLKYREIADELGLSIKTVEAQIGRALKQLRNKLADFLE